MSDPEPPSSTFLTTKEACMVLKISPSQLRVLRLAGLKSYSLQRPGTSRGLRRYRFRDLLAFLEIPTGD